MKSELQNPFRWSKSRAATFSDCKRKYYLRYYQHWGGWEGDAPPDARLAYRLGKMMTLATLVGTAVHEVLARHFLILRMGQFQELKPERAVEKMREVWRDAKKEFWRKNPKKFPPLFELYYQRVPPKDELQARAEQARSAIRRLREMPFYRRLRDLDRSAFLWVDPAAEKFSEETYFSVPPYEAIASPDLVYREGDRWIIVDWKTGKEGEGDRLQIVTAALWARQRYGAALEAMQGQLVYLSAAAVVEVDLDDTIAARTEGNIRRDMEAMAGCLKDPVTNIPREVETFPLHPNKKFCWHCEFQEICFPEGISGESIG